VLRRRPSVRRFSAARAGERRGAGGYHGSPTPAITRPPRSCDAARASGRDLAVGHRYERPIEGANPRGAKADGLDRAHQTIEADEVADAKRLVGASRERAEEVLHGLLRREGDGDAADAEPCEETRDGIAELGEQGDDAGREHRQLADARADGNEGAPGPVPPADGTLVHAKWTFGQ
jgi:hypothetical protein